MRSVVVCCYAISQGDKVFAKLAANLDANPALNLRIFHELIHDAGFASRLRAQLDAFEQRGFVSILPDVRL